MAEDLPEGQAGFPAGVLPMLPVDELESQVALKLLVTLNLCVLTYLSMGEMVFDTILFSKGLVSLPSPPPVSCESWAE